MKCLLISFLCLKNAKGIIFWKISEFCKFFFFLTWSSIGILALLEFGIPTYPPGHDAELMQKNNSPISCGFDFKSRVLFSSFMNKHLSLSCKVW